MKGPVNKIVFLVVGGLCLGFFLRYVIFPPPPPPQTPSPEQDTLLAVDCGLKTGLDDDGDGISNSIERNQTNKHLFDPNRCDQDPSMPLEKTLEGGINLMDKGTGYLHVTGGDKPDTDDWGTLELINCLEAVGRKAVTNKFYIVITDLSREHGGPFTPHISHKNELDVDMRYVAVEGHNGPLDLVLQSDLYDEVATQDILQEFVANKSCDPEFIFVDMDALQFTGEDIGSNVLVDAKGHTNHFHVRLKNKKQGPLHGSLATGSFLKRLASSGFVFGPAIVAAQVQPPTGPHPQDDLSRKKIIPGGQLQLRLPFKRPGDLSGTPAFQSESPIIVRVAPNIGNSIHNRKMIQRQKDDSAVLVDFFTVKNPRVRIREVAVVPRNRFVAVIETEEGTFENDEVKYKKMPKNRLRVLDVNGKTVCYPDHDVRAHALSPNGTKIAFIEGRFYEGGVGFIPTGVFVLDIKSCRITAIEVEDTVLPYDLEWLQTDTENKIFMQVLDPEHHLEKGLPVRVYDFKTNRIERTTSRGIHFSPDGTHYLIKPHEAIQGGLCKAGQTTDSCLRVYKTGQEEALEDFRNYERGKPMGWSYNKGAQLLFSKQTYERVTQSSRSRTAMRKAIVKRVLKATNIVVDVKTKKEVEKFDGEILGITDPRGWNTGREHILLRPNP